jgi:hypothetical protein|tara:strand:- start:1498 stop:2241 length:744 start_codon:yes stop_codon:yes gene_type:complete
MESNNKFPTEVIDLPSKGLLYSKDSPLSSGKVEMKYMTAKEEDILTNQNYIAKGTVIDKLLQSLIVDKKISYNDMLVGDKNALLIAARVLGYGKDYTFDYAGEKVTLDLSLLNAKEVDESNFADGKNEFSFTLPASGANITFKLLTHSDETKIAKEIEGLKRINKDASPELSTRLKYMITSVDGDSDTKTIREFVDNRFLARDSRAFRTYVSEIQPDIDLTFYPDNGPEKGVTIPLGVNFLWPDATV